MSSTTPVGATPVTGAISKASQATGVGFDYLLADRAKQLTSREWERLGVRRPNGQPFARTEERSFLLLPAGAQGPPGPPAAAAWAIVGDSGGVVQGQGLSVQHVSAVALRDRLKAFAAARGQSVQDVVERAVTRLLEQEAREPPALAPVPVLVRVNTTFHMSQAA